MNWTQETVITRAPDSKSMKAAEGLAKPAKWLTLGKTDTLLWGLFQGSSPRPYETQVDTNRKRFECSCPSRKQPCKHALALGLMYANNADDFNEEPAPAWVNVLPSDAAGNDADDGEAVPSEPFPELPESWQEVLGGELEQPYMRDLGEFLLNERATQTIYPKHGDVFNALVYTPYDEVKVLILGQDPYHGPRQAHGLSFSVQPGIATPPSLRNIFKELVDDMGVEQPTEGYLKPWAEEGVLMLNAVLTVRRGEANSHKNKGWEKFTDAVISAVNAKNERVVFILWGAYAQKKLELIDESQHTVIKSVHPSPLAARGGFFGSKPFSAANAALEEAGREPVNWDLGDSVPF